MGDNEDVNEPLAKTRTRRSNAGARMHEMMFAAEDDELLAQAFGLVKNDDDSSEDEEYVPKELNTTDADPDVDDEDSDSGDGDDDTSDSSDEDDASDESGVNDEDDYVQDGETCDLVGNNSKQTYKINETVIKHSSDSKFNLKSHLQIKREQNANAQSSKHVQSGSPTRSAYAACAKICCVCLGDQSDEDDEVVECDSCGVSVHESCYGVLSEEIREADDVSIQSNISTESTEPWFCEPCRRSVKFPKCELCPNAGGIFKETDTGRWVHMVCALYTRGVTFENVDNLSEVSLFEINYALFGSKTCTICEDRRLARSGICIGCDAGLCKTFFHASCAQREGLLFESANPEEIDPYFAQCKQHADRTIIKKKKKVYIALFARLRRIQPLEGRSERVRRKLEEITRRPDPHMTKWTQDNPPPVPFKVTKMLMTSPALILNLTKKSQLMGIDTSSEFMNVEGEAEASRQKWHIPPAFTLEFVAYCRDRTSRMIDMQKQNTELTKQNASLKAEESNLRERYNIMKDDASKLKLENDRLIQEARSLQQVVASITGKPHALPLAMEQLIARVNNLKTRNPSKGSKSTQPKSNTSTYGCGKCATVKDQHLLALCDTCNFYIHIYCLDPPLTRVPKKNKFGGWQCSDCSEKIEEEQDEAQEEQNELALQEAQEDGPRRLRERIRYPDKYCHESMLMADFWSTGKRRKKKSSKSSSKKVKVES